MEGINGCVFHDLYQSLELTDTDLEGECVFALREHSHNVQGVSWDPLNEYIATQSSDRYVVCVPYVPLDQW